MKFIKKHKNLILGILMVIAIIAAVFILRDTVMFDETTAVYGNRLEGIKDVKITSDQEKEVEAALESVAKNAKVRIAGKIVNVIIETNPETSLEDAKALSTTALEKFTEEQKNFYDFQFLIENSENESQFPIIGYMQHSRDSVSWTKDRELAEG